MFDTKQLCKVAKHYKSQDCRGAADPAEGKSWVKSALLPLAIRGWYATVVGIGSLGLAIWREGCESCSGCRVADCKLR